MKTFGMKICAKFLGKITREFIIQIHLAAIAKKNSPCGKWGMSGTPISDHKTL